MAACTKNLTKSTFTCMALLYILHFAVKIPKAFATVRLALESRSYKLSGYGFMSLGQVGRCHFEQQDGGDCCLHASKGLGDAIVMVDVQKSIQIKS